MNVVQTTALFFAVSLCSLNSVLQATKKQSQQLCNYVFDGKLALAESLREAGVNFGNDERSRAARGLFHYLERDEEKRRAFVGNRGHRLNPAPSS